MTCDALDRMHPGGCGSCTFFQGRGCQCLHPKKERNWRVPMIANCFYHEKEDDEAHA